VADAPTDEREPDGGPPVGTVLEGRYRLRERLGEGGVGWVYRAEHLKLGTEVAVKMLQAPYAQHEMLRPRFEREAKALAALRHPHIVTLTDYSLSEDGHPYLVMELLEGRTLAELIAEGPLEEGRARRILGQILDALIYAHGKGFAHRDLKPTNVFLVELPTDPDHVKILDFGFVKLLGGERGDKPALTRSGIAFGTPSYMCPEQATGGRTDPRADLYSAGVVLFEMLAGRRPFVGEIPEVIRQHLTEPVPPLDVGGAPRVATPELAALLERAMAKEPVDRFQTAEAMRAALDALPTPAVRSAREVDGRSDTLPAPPRDPAPPRAAATRLARQAVEARASEVAAGGGPARRRRTPVRLALAALTVLGGAGVLWWSLSDEAPAGGDGRAEGPAADMVFSRPEGPGSRSGAAGPESGEGAPPEGAGRGGGEPGSAVSAGPGSAAGPVGAPGEASGEPAAAPSPDDGSGAGASAAASGPGAAGDESEGATSAAAAPGLGSADEGSGSATSEAPGAGEAAGVPARAGGASDAVDPWASREPVARLDAARRRVRAGRPLSRSGERAMRRYVRDHRDDPRPHLILARHFVARGHDLSAVQRYSLAYRVDPAARHDPQMLADLVGLARRPVVTDDAAELLARAYGAEATPSLERALAEDALEPAARQRLRAVLERLAAEP
jgi:serine/threonine-protein kinase